MADDSSEQLVRLKRLDAIVSKHAQHTLIEHRYYGWRSTAPEKFTWSRPYEPIARGGFATVYREECVGGDTIGSVRAVKALKKPTMGELSKIDFSRELKTIARFSKPEYAQFFVNTSGWYETPEEVYLIMEFAEHGSLEQYIGQGLPEWEVQIIVYQVLRGLDCMHTAGFAHRDLKPQNLLVMHKAPDWHIKIADFGLSKRLMENLSSTNTGVGTPAFMAPEILGISYVTESDSSSDSNMSGDENVQSRSKAADIWAVGITLFILLTGELPFSARDRKALSQYAKGKIDLLEDRMRLKNISALPSALIRKLLAADPTKRPSANLILSDRWIDRGKDYQRGPLSRDLDVTEHVETSGTTASANWDSISQHTIQTRKSGNRNGVSHAQNINVGLEETSPDAPTGGKKALGAEDKWVIHSAHDLGSAHYEKGEYQEAENMFICALIGREKMLGAHHKSTLATLYYLGRVYNKQKRYDKAEEMYLRALAGREKVLGAQHKDTLHTVHNLGNVYEEQGRYNKAVELLLRALAGREKVLGAQNKYTLHTVHSLGFVYMNHGLYDKAVELYLRALAGYNKVLGAQHKNTLDTVYDLGNVYYKQGMYDKAVESYLRALAGQEKVLGAQHKDTLHTVHNLGNVYYNQERYDKAEESYLRALAGREKVLGAQHKDTLGTTHNLGNVYYKRERYDKAEETYLRALAGQEKVLGAQHEDTLGTARRLSDTYRRMGKRKQAQQMERRARTKTRDV